MSLSINHPRHHNSAIYITNKKRHSKIFHGIRGTKVRDTKHKNTGYEAHLTGYEAQYSRDTRHTNDGIRDTALTGYEAQK
jgi:hypothetical protein